MRAPRTDGLLLVDKPVGMTSHAVVSRVRRVVGIQRIGHAGTLDPFATGLLVLLVNRATRLAPFLDAEPKVYRARVRFGTRTTTDDLAGDPIAEAPPPEQAVVERAIASLTGNLLQMPPAYSAKQVGGTRAYVAARRGKPLDLEPVGVVVHEWTVLERNGPDLDVEIRCSGGTYVRALARDLGEATGSAAHLSALRRLRSGRFDVSDAIPVDAIEAGNFELIAPDVAVGQLPRQVVDDLDARRITHGQTIVAQATGELAALCHANELLAIAVREGESWRPKVVMRDA
ncbi:MAG TPA: tRNA pseudouridine(55) synthase TruB [Gemmatimonadaceae bacterium]|nr:tRNA pseudouridine(55) synthase TruB [Gemmatimonadaceae bacterium]